MSAKPKMLDVRGWSLLLPSILAAIGFCAFAVLAFSFTELQSLPATFRRGLVVGGSFALALGGELGTLANVIEIFRKRKRAEVWDWLSLFISALATMAAFILSFAALLGVNATWSAGVKLYGPIVLGVVAGFDAYAGFAEVGMYLSTYDERLLEWERKQEQAAEHKRADAERLRRAVAQGVADELQRLEEEAQAAREVRRLEREQRRLAQTDSQPARVALVEIAAPAQPAIPANGGNGHHSHICVHCGAEFDKAQGLSAHLRHCEAYKAQKAQAIV